MRTPNSVLVYGRQIATLPLIRALGKRKIPVFQFHHQPRDFSTFSKYSKFMQCFHPLEEEKKLLGQLIIFARRFDQKTILFPISDEFILFVSNNSTELEKYFVFYRQSFDIDKLLNKKDFLDVCRKSGMNYPKSITSSRKSDIYDFFNGLKSPIIAKRASHYIDVGDEKFWKAIMLNNRKDIDNFFSCYRPDDFIFQENIPGDDTDLISYLSLVDKYNESKMELVGRKIAQYPLQFGSATIAEQIDDKNALKLGKQWVDYLKLKGPSQVEFIKDKRDGELKILEINPRFIYWSSIMTNTWDDVYYAAYRDLRGEKIAPTQFANADYYWVYFIRYLESLFLFGKSPKTFLKKLAVFFRKKQHIADIDFFDLKPVLYHIFSDLKKIFKV